MPGIVAYNAYLPAYRMARGKIAEAWGGRAPAGEKICARFDEDALTMAASATWDCLTALNGKAKADIGSLFFASTTAPYLERQNASIIAALCDLAPTVLTADLAACLRSATTGLVLALDRVRSGGGSAVVCASDTREAEPGSPEEQIFSDAAAAVAVGDSAVIAELVAACGTFDDFFETTRRDRDAVVNSFPGKFSIERGYQRPLGNVLQQALVRAGLAAKDIARLVLPSPDARSHLQLAAKLGFQNTQVQDIAWNDLGLSGCPMPLLLLCATLEEAKPGDYILLGAYGNGADALLFRATHAIASYKPRVSLASQRKSSLAYSTYTLMQKARQYRQAHDDGLEITNIFYAKEEVQNVHLRGSECRHCGTRHFPLTKVCARCEKADALVEVALERSGQVFTFAVDHLAASPFPPVIMAVVDLDGGGRIYSEVVDTTPEQVRIGTPVELVVRRLKEGGGLHHYYWKCRPRRW